MPIMLTSEVEVNKNGQPSASGNRKRRPRKKRQVQPQPPSSAEQPKQTAPIEKVSPVDSSTSNEKRLKKKKRQNESGLQEEQKSSDQAVIAEDAKPRKKSNRRRRKSKAAAQQQQQSTPIRDDKRRIPAMQIVTAAKPKISLVQYRPPPYECKPPRRCDMTKMTIVKLTNVDGGVDINGSLLFWAFKMYGWIDNVYVVPQSFNNRQTGVAFIGFRSDHSAMQAVNNSGTEQLFGRRIFVTLYAARRPRPTLLTLQAETLKKVFERLDWRTRLRCESVCKKFNNILKQLYEKRSYWSTDFSVDQQEWIGLPDKVAFVFVADVSEGAEESKNDVSKVSTNSVKVVRVPTDVKRFNSILSNILRKFYTKINSLEFHNARIDSETIHLLNAAGSCLQSVQGPRWDPGRLLMKGCIMDDMFAEDIMDFLTYYGDRLVVEE